MSQCKACRETGWVSFQREVDGHSLPWSGACLCARGRYLSEPRECRPSGAPLPAGARPVVVEPVTPAVFRAAIDRATGRAGDEA